MRKIFGISVALLGLAAPAHAAPTWLIGSWTVVPEAGRTCATTSFVFTATTETSTSRATESFPSETTTTPVRYVGDASEIYTMGPGGASGAMRWEPKDANHVKETSFSGCTYQRKK
jgi:hypothetical protein